MIWGLLGTSIYAASGLLEILKCTRFREKKVQTLDHSVVRGDTFNVITYIYIYELHILMAIRYS